LGAVAATAVVAGTATMTARAINGSMNRRAATQQEAAAYESEQAAAQQAPTAQPAAAEPTATDLASQLQALGELHANGVLSDSEFAAAKAQLLTG
jgi:hypothetical protein